MKGKLSLGMLIFIPLLLLSQVERAESAPDISVKANLNQNSSTDSSSVRLAIKAASGSGIEQDIVDYISARFRDDANVIISTVNPDWIVECLIADNQDRLGGQIRYNGTVTIKTLDGQLVGTVSVQKYNQDYSVQPGAPLNKVLVDSAAKDVINMVGERAAEKINQAVEIEVQVRSQIAKAELFANKDNYDQGISVLKEIGRDSVHFQAVQSTIVHYEMEKQALELVKAAEVKAKAGQYVPAITLLKQVDAKSKRYKLSKQLAVKYKNLLAAARRHTNTTTLVKNKTKDNNANATLH